MFVLKVNKSTIRVLESETIYGDSRNIYNVVLLFNEDWNGLTKVITFDNEKKSKPIVADATRSIVTTSIPWELLTYPGTIRVSVAGARNNLVVLPTQICVLGKVHKGNTVEYPPDVKDPPATPTVADQLLNEIAKKGDTIEFQDGILYLYSDGKVISQTEIQNGSDNGNTGIVSGLDNETISDESFFGSDTNKTYALKNVTIEYIDQENEPATMVFEDDVVQVVSDNGSLTFYKIDGKVIKFLSSEDGTLKLGSVEYPTTGDDGLSAYEVAVNNGFVGTEQEWLDSLKGVPGTDGKSAYELAVQDGFEGTLEEWLDSLHGGAGLSAYEIAVNHGFEGDEQAWLDSLKGKPGAKGAKGEPGKTAYQLAVENGFEGTEEEWLASLKGEAGKSAYEIAVENGFDGTEEEWLDSLHGEGGGGTGDISSTDVDKIRVLDQEAADQITNKSPKTLYFIKG